MEEVSAGTRTVFCLSSSDKAMANWAHNFLSDSHECIHVPCNIDKWSFSTDLLNISRVLFIQFHIPVLQKLRVDLQRVIVPKQCTLVSRWQPTSIAFAITYNLVLRLSITSSPCIFTLINVVCFQRHVSSMLPRLWRSTLPATLPGTRIV